MGKFIDMTGWNMWEHGIPNSRLTVIKRTDNIGTRAAWVCECNCSNKTKKVVTGTDLRLGEVLSCGCLQKENASLSNKNKIKPGDVFGRLTVLEEMKERNKYGDIIYKCQCSCENKTICYKISKLLKNGKTTSCGCYQKELLIQKYASLRKLKVGDKIGHWTLLEYFTDNETSKGYFVCQCDCENRTIKNVSINNLSRGISQSCGCDRSSKGEKLIAKILQENNISFITQWDNNKTFRYVDSNRPIKFDFYLPDYNCCIEYDGEQHFVGWNYKKDNLSLIQKKDLIRNEICKSNNIKLIRIPYMDLKKINFDYLKERIGII